MKRNDNYLAKSLAILALSFSATNAVAQGEIRFVGETSIPGESIDLSGLTQAMEDGTPANQLGGFSAITALEGNRYLVLPDRGPKDGAVSFPCRFHEIEVVIDESKKPAVSMKLIKTTLLKDEKKGNLIGLAAAIPGHGERSRLDPEGIRINKRGEVLISDEYGPSVNLFDKAGIRQESWSIPERFALKNVRATPEEELEHNKIGRQPNGGFEGLAITPKGKVWAFAQKPLLQDSQPDSESGKRVGSYCRIVEFNAEGAATDEWAYRVEGASSGISEILAIDESRALVLERDGLAGKEALLKKVFLIDFSKATSVKNVASLGKELPENIRPVAKVQFLDMLDERFGLAGENFSEKPEGLAFGPKLADGSQTLIVAVDNDFESTQASKIWVFAFNATELRKEVSAQ